SYNVFSSGRSLLANSDLFNKAPVPVKNRSIFLQLKILIAKRGRLPNIRKLCWRIRTAIVAGAAHSARAGAAMDMAHKDFWGPAWPPILA
ncbi:hypothetical protein, partial [Pantoea agglomerans]|uniref:hypothetical protein n=1 Tax=Enterobacter agglomerans TaxID=549 RepID=UPI001A7E8BD8